MNTTCFIRATGHNTKNIMTQSHSFDKLRENFSAVSRGYKYCGKTQSVSSFMAAFYVMFVKYHTRSKCEYQHTENVGKRERERAWQNERGICTDCSIYHCPWCLILQILSKTRNSLRYARYRKKNTRIDLLQNNCQ